MRAERSIEAGSRNAAGETEAVVAEDRTEPSLGRCGSMAPGGSVRGMEGSMNIRSMKMGLWMKEGRGEVRREGGREGVERVSEG